MALSHGAMGWSAVFDCSFSLAFFVVLTTQSILFMAFRVQSVFPYRYMYWYTLIFINRHKVSNIPEIVSGTGVYMVRVYFLKKL